MNNLEITAKKVLSKTKIEPDQKFGSVLAVLMIIGIIVNVVRAVQECEKVKEVEGFTEEQACTFWKSRFKYLSLKRGWLTNMKLRKIIRQHLSVEDCRKHRTEIQNAILDVGLDLSDSETYTLMEALND